MRLMITGSKGFIGSYLVRHFSEIGHQVYEAHRGVVDLTNAESVRQMFDANFYDAVIHCALAGREQIYDISDENYLANLAMFNNIWANRHRFRRMINLGSGNEFDTETDIFLAHEDHILDVEPRHSYAKAKNEISRRIRETEEFYTLRLFGVMHYTEGNRRFFSKIKATSPMPFTIDQDRYFDYINLEDVPPMIDVVMNGQSQHKDINMVYHQKMKLSEMANMFSAIQMLPTDRIKIKGTSDLNFTGDGQRFASYNLPQLGLPLGMLRY
jgi:nucleoside-diphosphate-sugar epimerase